MKKIRGSKKYGFLKFGSGGVTKQKKSKPYTRQELMLGKEASNAANELWVLEPRMVFDGAAVATHEAVIASVDAAHSLPAADIAVKTVDAPHSLEPVKNDVAPVVVEASKETTLIKSSIVTFAPDIALAPVKEIIFIDGSLKNIDTLVADVTKQLGDTGKVVVLDAHKDGVDQITETLAANKGVQTVQILSHGSDGNLYLGNADLSLKNMDKTYAADFASIKSSLAPNAQILIYGCDFAKTELGDATAHKLADLTGASVAASIDATGSAELGGNWVLEDHIGTINVKEIKVTNWEGLLAKTNTTAWSTPVVSTVGVGAAAVTTTASSNTVDGVTTTITFTNKTGASGTTPGTFSGTAAGTLANITNLYDNAAAGAADLSTVFNSTGGTDAGTITISFSTPVTNPEINIDRLGGIVSGKSNSSLWTLTSGQTLSVVSGGTPNVTPTPSLAVTSTTIKRTVNVTTAGSATSLTDSAGTAGGTVRVTGVGISTITFNIAMDQANPAGVGDGFGIGLTLDAPPIANNDRFIANQDVPYTLNVLANDTDARNDTLTITKINGTAITVGGAGVAVTGGVVTLDATQKLIFTPTAGLVSSPSFTYTATDANGGISTATVTGNVIPKAPIIVTTGDSANLLVNGDFEAPVVPLLNQNNLQGITWGGWTTTASLINVIHVDGTGYTSGSANANSGVQFVDLSGAGYISQNFTLSSAQTIFFGAEFSNRDSANIAYLSSNDKVEILNSSNVVVATSTVAGLYKGLGDQAWLPSTGTATLAAGTYTYRAFLGDYSHVDTAFVRPVSNNTVTFTEAGSSVAIATIGSSVYELNSTDIQANGLDISVAPKVVSASIVLTNAQASDVFTIGALPSGIASAIDTSVAGKITVTLTGASTTANYQSAIQAIKFSNATINPSSVDRIVNVTVNDGISTSNTAVTTIKVTQLPPAATGTLANQTYFDSASGISIATASGFIDPAGWPLTYSATGLPAGFIINAVTGVITGTLDHNASQNAPSVTGAGATLDGKYTITVTIKDAANRSAAQTFTLDSLNQAPAIAVNTPAQTGQDGATISSLSIASAFNDPNAGDTLTFTATGLPTGLTITSAGVISGTLDKSASQGGVAGVYTVSITATDNKGATKVETFTYTVTNPAPVIVTAIPATVSTDGSVISLPLAANFKDGGSDTDTLTYSATGLPAGLTINTTTGVVSGTLSNSVSQGGTGGVYAVSVTANDGQGGTVTSNFNWTITNPAPILIATIADKAVNDGAAFSLPTAPNFKDGGSDTDILTYSATGLPAGLTINAATGVISGTIPLNASTLGAYTATITANDGQGGILSTTFKITSSNQAPVLGTVTPNKTGIDAATITTIDTSTSFTDPNGDTLTYTATGLPAGLSISSAGLITGVLDRSASQGAPGGIYTVKVTASDGKGGATSETFTYTVTNPAPTASGILARTSTDGQTTSYNIPGFFNDPDGDPLTFSATGLPSGLTINPATGLISGTLSSSASQGGTGGVYVVSVTANDGQGGTVTSNFNWTVTNPAPVQVGMIATQNVTDGNAASIATSTAFKDGGSDTDTLTYSATGLPAGLTINTTTGVISGTMPNNASTAGPYSVVVTANDGQGGTVTQSFQIASTNQAPTTVLANITPDKAASDGSVANFSVANAFKDSNNDTLAFSATGLPAGLTIDPVAGVVSGTIAADASQGNTVGQPLGTYVVVVTANDGKGGIITESFKYVVGNVAPAIAVAIPAKAATDGSGVSFSVTANFKDGGSDADTLTYSATGLPAGLTINSTTGVISGTVASNASQGGAGGVYNVSVTANDGQGGTVSSIFNYTITNPAPVVVAVITDQIGTDGDAITLSIASNFKDGGSDTDILTYSATGLPAGLTINAATGVISGTLPTTASTTGPYSVVVTANDGQGGAVATTFRITSTNQAPTVLVVTTPQTSTDGSIISLDVAPAFKDPNGDALTYSATGLPTGLTISAAGVISGTLDKSASQGGTAGVYSVKVTASDGKGGTVFETFSYTVTNPAPVVVTAVPTQVVNDGNAFSLNVASNFVDGASDTDPLTFTATGLPSGLTISTAGLISGTLPANASTVGPYTVEVTASDGQGGTVRTSFIITANPLAPYVSAPTPAQVYKDGDLITIVNTSTAFTSPSSSPFTFTATGLPAGLSIDPVTGFIFGMIDKSASQAGVIGVYAVKVTATDGTSASVSETVTFTITNPPPVPVGTVPDQALVDGQITNISLLVPSITSTGFTNFSDVYAGTYSFQPATAFGWNTDNTNPAGQLEVGQATTYGGTVANGQLMELEGAGGDVGNIYKNFTGAVGDKLNVTFDLSSRVSTAGVGHGVNVYFEGVLIDTIIPSTTFGFVNHSYNVVQTTTTSRFEIRAIENDGSGELIDNLGYTQTTLTPGFKDGANDSDVLTYNATGLPSGLTFNPATGVISGTLDHSASQSNTLGDPKGVYTVVITANDGQGGTAVQTFKINASNAAPVVTTATLAQAAQDGDVVSVATATAFKDGGPDSDTLTYTASNLPAGLSINASTGIISGVIDRSASQGGASGVYAVTVTATDNEGGAVSEVFNYTTSNPAPVVTSTINSVLAIDAFPLTVSTAATFKDGLADTDTLTYSATGLPLGLSINSTTGVISGILDKNASQLSGGVYSVIVTASDNQGGTVTNAFSISAANSAPVLVAGSGTPAQIAKDGDIVGFSIVPAFNDVNSDTLTYSATGLPAGLILNPLTGQIFGTIDHSASQGGAAGVYSVVITASDGKGGSVSETFTYIVTNSAPIIATPEGAQIAKDGDIINLNITPNFKDGATDTDTLTYSSTGLPSGLTLNTTTGIISGTLDKAASQGGIGGVYTIAITASDGQGGTVTDTFSYTVTNPAPVVTTAIPNQSVNDGAAFSLGVSANFKDGASDTDILTYSATGLPAGLAIDPTTGAITGTLPANASVAGPYTVIVTASDGQGGTVSSSFQIAGSNAPPTVIAPTADQIGNDGDVVNLNAAPAFKDPNGDVLAFTATGLPAGLSINSATGVISGTVDHSASQGGVAGTYTIIVTASDGKGGTVTDTFTYTVSNPAPVTTGTLADVTQSDGQAVSINASPVFKDGGTDTDALTYSATGLPAGLTIDPTSGKITGTIDHSASQGGVGGAYTINVSVSDGQGGSTSTSFVMSVTNPPPVVVSPIIDQTAQDGKAFSLNTAPNFKDGSTDTDSIIYSATGLPAGVSINTATGVISGTLPNNASVNGPYTIVVTASDGQGGSATDTFLITSVNLPPVATSLANQSGYDGGVANINTTGSFNDPNGNILIYSVTGLPAGLIINSVTGIISGTVDHSASQGGMAGVYNIQVTASNGISTPVTASFNYSVTNTAPIVVTPISNQIVNDGQLFVFNVGSNFKDGGADTDTLTYSATGLPAGLVINPTTGVISGLVAANASATFPITIAVTVNDGQGGTITNSFALNSNNQAPGILVPIPPQIGLDGAPVNLNISASFRDPNGDTLTFTAANLPVGLSIDSATGIITGTIDHSASQAGVGGVYSVTITATDNKGAATPQTFSWTSTNPAPVIVTPIGDVHSGNSQYFTGDISPNFKDGGFDTDTLTYSAVGLPPAFTIDAATGVISGTTPATGTAHGPYPITVTAIDGQGGTVSTTFNFVPDVTLVIATTGPVPAQINTDGTPINLDISGSFIEPNAAPLSFAAAGLPSGLSIDAATGVITGTIDHFVSQTGGGIYTVTLTVTDNVGAITTATFRWNVSNVAPIIVTPVADSAVNDGQPVSINVSGSFKDGAADTDKLTYSATGLPPGIVIDPNTGVISGTMDKNASLHGAYIVTVTVGDGQGGTVSDVFDITSYNQSPAIVAGKATPAQTAQDGDSISLNISTAFADPNGDGITFAATGLPAGLSLNTNTGVISGTIDHSASKFFGGVYSITIVASDGKGGSVFETFAYTVTNSAPVVAVAIPDQIVNDGAVFGLNVAPNFKDGGSDSDIITYSATGLPAGLSIDPVTGTISGILPRNASTSGPYIVAVTANDGQGGTISQSFTITSNNQIPVFDISTSDQTGLDGSPVTFEVSAAFKDPNGDALTYSVTGLPAGLAIDPVTGKITGTIDHSASQGGIGGVYSVTVTATDTKGAGISENFGYTVANPTPVVVATVPDQAVQDGKSFSINVSPNFKDGAKDTDALTYSATGLPVGLTLNPITGVISGTVPKNASSVGPYTVSISANDGQGGTIATTFKIISINQAPDIAVLLPTQVTADGSVINLNIGAGFIDQNGDPLTFSATGLPTGLSLNPVTGIITGTVDHSASQAGPYSVTISASDGKGGQANQIFTYNVINPTPVVTVALPNQNVHDGTAFTLSVAVNFKDGGSDTDTLTYTATGLPVGLTINPVTGVITGVLPKNASSQGPYSVAVTASDGQGGTISSIFLITSVNDLPVAVPSKAIPAQSATDGSSVSLNVSAAFADPNSDALTFSAVGLPNGLSINTLTGIISGTIDPSASQSGPYTVTITASDGKGGIVSEIFTYNINNIVPVVTALIPDQLIQDSHTINLSVVSSFKDGGADRDTLTYSATGLPVGVTIDPVTGIISGTVPANLSTSAPLVIMVTASDGQGGIVTTPFNLIGLNDPPVVENIIPTANLTDGATVSLDIHAAFSDPNGDLLTYSAAGLPLGLTINPTTGVISGTVDHTASQNGSYNVKVKATDIKGGAIDQVFAINVTNPVPVVVVAIPTQNVHDGAPFFLPVAPNFKDGGSDTDVLSYVATGLPVGLTINPVTGVISGTLPKDASSIGPYSVTVTASDGQGGTVASLFTLISANDAPSIIAPLTNKTTSDGAVVSINAGTSFADLNSDPLSFTATGLPVGLTINPVTGVISGTVDHSASLAGSYSVTITASDGKGGLTPQTFTLGVANIPPVVVASIPDQSVHDGAPFNLTTAPNFKDGGVDTDTLSYSSTGLPAGLSIDPVTGIISGTLPKNASQAGPYSVTVTANDGQGGTISTVFVIASVNDVPSIVSPLANISSSDGAPISINTGTSFADTNGDPLTFTATGLPAGLTIDPATGLITGTVDHSASVTGLYSVKVTASDSKGGLIPQTFTFGVVNPAPVVVAIIPNQSVLDNAPFSLPVALKFRDGGADTDTLSYTATGLPAGLSINPVTGVISGVIPSNASTKGAYAVTVTANDGQGGTVASTFLIAASNDAPSIVTPLTNKTTTDGAVVSINAGASFADPNGEPLSFTATGLPKGLTIDPVTGIISGTVDHSASVSEPYSVTITASDGKGGLTTQTFTFGVANTLPVVVASIPNQNVHDGAPFSLTTAPNFKDGGADTDTLSYTATGLPVGLSINPVTGIISGTLPKNASQAGPYSVTIIASDGQGGTVTSVFIIKSVNDVPSVIILQPAVTAPEGSEFKLDISGSFKDMNGDPLNYGATGLPPGLTINPSTGIISGTLDPYASQNGPYTIVISASDGKGGTVKMPFTFNVPSIPHFVEPLPVTPKIVAEPSVVSAYKPYADSTLAARDFAFPPIQAEGYILEAVEGISGLGGFNTRINAPGIIDQTVNDIGKLHNTGELAPVQGAVLSQVYSLRDDQKFIDPSRAGSPDSIWSLRRPEGFTLRLDVDGTANSAQFNSGHQLLLDSLDRGRSIMVRFVAVSGQTSASRVVSYETLLANGNPLPGYIQADPKGFMTIEKLATAGKLDLAIRVKLENGSLINWRVSVDLSTGELKYIDAKESVKQIPFERTGFEYENPIKFAELSADKFTPAPERMMFSAQLKAHSNVVQAEASHLAKMLLGG